MVAFGQQKKMNKNESMETYEQGEIQSYLTILSNLMIYNTESVKNKIKEGRK